MSFPKLNLKKHHCDLFHIHLTAILNKEIYSKMLGSGIFSGFSEKEPNVLVKNYKSDGQKYTMTYLAHCFEEKKRNRVVSTNVFRYESGLGKLQGGPPFKVSFAKLHTFFKTHNVACRGSSMSLFVFPLEEYEPIIPLPFREDRGVVPDKKIEIRGLDLSVESNAQKYRQTINVEEKSIIERVGILDIQDSLSVTLIKNTFDSMVAYAGELVRKKKRGKNAVSK